MLKYRTLHGARSPEEMRMQAGAFTIAIATVMNRFRSAARFAQRHAYRIRVIDEKSRDRLVHPLAKSECVTLDLLRVPLQISCAVRTPPVSWRATAAAAPLAAAVAAVVATAVAVAVVAVQPDAPTAAALPRARPARHRCWQRIPPHQSQWPHQSASRERPHCAARRWRRPTRRRPRRPTEPRSEAASTATVRAPTRAGDTLDTLARRPRPCRRHDPDRTTCVFEHRPVDKKHRNSETSRYNDTVPLRPIRLRDTNDHVGTDRG